jgi:hypothetical protein
MIISLVTLKTPEIEDYAQHTFEINKRYCVRHGFNFCGFRAKLADNRPASWSKIPALKYTMDGGFNDASMRPVIPDYVVWIDADAAIMNQDIRLDALIPDKAQCVFTEELDGINAGVFIMRNTPFCKAILAAAWRLEQYTLHPHWEQAAFRHLFMEEKTQFAANTEIIPKRYLNAFHPGDYVPGDFIAHMPGETLGARTEFFKTANEKQKQYVCK